MKKFVYGCVIFPLLGCCCVLGLLFFAADYFDPCGDVVIGEVRSPNNQFKAVIFERDCGATTDFSTQVSILPVGASLRGAGNIFVAEDNHGATPSGRGGGPNVDVEWLNSRQLQIAYDHRAATFNRLQKYQDITIVYQVR